MGRNVKDKRLIFEVTRYLAVPYLRLLVAGFLPQSRGIYDGSSTETGFLRYFGFPANHSTDCSTLIIIHHLGLVLEAN
jgi:hypothetical protein